MFLQPMKKEDIPPMTLMSMWNQVRNAATQGVQGGFAKVGETIQKTPLLKLGVNVLNAADYGLGTVAKTTEGLLTDRVNTLKNLQYQRGEGLKSYANRNVTDISPYITQKVAGTQIGQKFPMVAPILGLGAGMLTPSPSDALKVGKFATQAGDVAKLSDEATDLVKPSMLDDTTVFRGIPKEGKGTGFAAYGKGLYVTDNEKIAKTYAKGDGKIDTFNINASKMFDAEKYKIDGDIKDFFVKQYEDRGYNNEMAKDSVNRLLNFARENSSKINNYRGELEYLSKQVGLTDDTTEELAQIIKDRGYQGIRYLSAPEIEGHTGTNYVLFDKNAIKPKLDPLASEAKKYKSAEEFVKGQTNYYYGGGNEITKIDGRKISRGGELGEGFYFTGDVDKAKLYGGTITNLNVELKNPLIITKDELWKKDGLIDKYNQNPKYNQELVKQGYDGVLVKDGNKIDQGIVFSPSQIKTKSQLTDIWNKAQGK